MSGNRGVRDVIAMEAIALYESGLSLVQVGKRLLVSSRTIAVILAEAKVPTRPVRKVRAKIADEAIKLYAGGLSTFAVGQQLGVSHATIEKILDEAGVQRRPKHIRGRQNPINHGTLYAYDARGCRCDPCVEVKLNHLQRARERRASRRTEPA